MDRIVFINKHGERRDTPKFGFRKYLDRDGKLYPHNARARHRAIVKLNKAILAGEFDHLGTPNPSIPLPEDKQ
jgi:hypothetical protein